MAHETGFGGGVMSGNILRTAEPGAGNFAPAAPVASVGAGIIARSERIRDQAIERNMSGAPRMWKVTNRALHGNVKAWSGTFDSVRYPEGATDDKATWLHPGQSMILPIDAGLHFCGNIFHATFEEARNIIISCGGFQMETKRDYRRGEAPKVIGGPLFLPDFIIEPMDGRMRTVSVNGRTSFELYTEYEKLTRKLRVLPSLNIDKETLREERERLAERIAEYNDTPNVLYDMFGNETEQEPQAAQVVLVECECSPIPHSPGSRGCARAGVVDQDNGEPVLVRPRRGGGRKPKAVVASPSDDDDQDEE